MLLLSQLSNIDSSNVHRPSWLLLGRQWGCRGKGCKYYGRRVIMSYLCCWMLEFEEFEWLWWSVSISSKSHITELTYSCHTGDIGPTWEGGVQSCHALFIIKSVVYFSLNNVRATLSSISNDLYFHYSIILHCITGLYVIGKICYSS